MFKVQRTDVVLFPFSDAQLDEGGLTAEYMMYANRNGLDCIDEDQAPEGGFPTNLVIVGHGSDEPDFRQTISGGKNIHRSTVDIAAKIRKLGFPGGPGHEILVWSCHSGGVGGFAQMLALHLTSVGYSGIKVWGCNAYAGVIERDGTLTGRSTVKGDNARLSLADLDYWVGV